MGLLLRGILGYKSQRRGWEGFPRISLFRDLRPGQEGLLATRKAASRHIRSSPSACKPPTPVQPHVLPSAPQSGRVTDALSEPGATTGPGSAYEADEADVVPAFVHTTQPQVATGSIVGSIPPFIDVNSVPRAGRDLPKPPRLLGQSLFLPAPRPVSFHS